MQPPAPASVGKKPDEPLRENGNLLSFSPGFSQADRHGFQLLVPSA